MTDDIDERVLARLEARANRAGERIRKEVERVVEACRKAGVDSETQRQVTMLLVTDAAEQAHDSFPTVPYQKWTGFYNAILGHLRVSRREARELN